MADKLWKYATSGKTYVPLLLASTQNFASTGTVTLASTDATIIKDGSTWAALTNTPTAIAMGSRATFEVIWSASEATAKDIVIQIKDETGALVQDQQINIVTYGSSLAAHEFDLDQSIENSTMNAVVSVTSDVSGKVVGSVASVLGNVAGNVTGNVGGDVQGNVDGSVTSVSSDVAGKVVGAVGSVAGNVDGSVGSVATNVTFSSTSLARADIRQIGGSTSPFDNLEDDYDGTGYNKANSEIGTAAALTANNDKTGYGLSSTGINDVSTGTKSEINDLIFTDASSDASSLAGSLGNKTAWLYQRFFRHHQQDSSTQVVMQSGSTSAGAAFMTVTNTTLLQTVQEATTA